MEADTYRFLADREETYWWHRARRHMVLGLLRRHGIWNGCRWLDLGCGPGGNLTLLKDFAPGAVVGVDLSPIATAIAMQKAPHAQIVRADIKRPLPFADASFDLATIFNVLYHTWIISEVDVLAEVRRVLRPGGLAVITEPAFAVLMRQMDRAAMTRRRYRRPQFRALCHSAGLSVRFLSYFTSFGFPIFVGLKAVQGALAPRGARLWGLAADMKPLSAAVNEPMYCLAMLEARAIAHGIALPFGTTLVCVTRKDPAETANSSEIPKQVGSLKP